MARTQKTTDQLLAESLAALQGGTKAEKSVEEKQREEAVDHVRGVLAAALSGLDAEKYTGESKDLIAKAAGNLHSALRNATQAVKKQADPSVLAGVITQEPQTDGPAVLA